MKLFRSQNEKATTIIHYSLFIIHSKKVCVERKRSIDTDFLLL